MDGDDLWNATTKDQVMYIFYLDYSQAYLRIATCVLVFDDISVKLYCYDKECTKELSSMLGSDLQLKCWSQLENVLIRFRYFSCAVDIDS